MVSKKIGLAGRSGSGKDVVADYICERYGYSKIAVADSIRDECFDFMSYSFRAAAEIFPASFDIVRRAFEEAVYAKPTTPEIRVLLQWWGTEYRRSHDSDYWVKKLVERLTEGSFIVVSDVRLPIEIDAIHNAGGEVWFVERPGVQSVGIPNHLTEIGLDGAVFDRTIMNHGTLKDLRATVDWIFKEC